ncbi:MAG: AraC family transcriptional regulator [Ginsengibacter sp.]
MVSDRCIMMVSSVFARLGIQDTMVNLGKAEFLENVSMYKYDQIKNSLLAIGLEVLDDKKSVLIEKIKNVIIELVHYSLEEPETNLSDYLSTKLHYDYTYLSNLFSEMEGFTIEKFIISHKIERAKELIEYDEFNLTEISRKLHYSSVAHLSNQFKKITGLTPTNYKQMNQKRYTTVVNA